MFENVALYSVNVFYCSLPTAGTHKDMNHIIIPYYNDTIGDSVNVNSPMSTTGTEEV